MKLYSIGFKPRSHKMKSMKALQSVQEKR